MMEVFVRPATRRPLAAFATKTRVPPAGKTKKGSTVRSGLTGDPKVPVAKFDFAALAAAEPEPNILADA